jgi:hypothetical protein
VSTDEAGTAAARHADLAAARLLLSRMGVSPADLLAARGIVKTCGSKSLVDCGWGVFVGSFDQLPIADAGLSRPVDVHRRSVSAGWSVSRPSMGGRVSLR